MAITAPSGFTCGKSTVYPGETITCIWTAAKGDFDEYDILLSGPDGFHRYYPSKTATSYKITIPETYVSYMDVDIVFSLYAIKGNRNNPTDSAEGGSFTAYIVSAPQVEPDTPPAPASITVGEYVKGQPVAISWSGVEFAEQILYSLQLSTDGGLFMTCYDGPNTSYTLDVSDSVNSLQFRVRTDVYTDRSRHSDWVLSDVKTAGTVTPPTPVTGGARLEQFQNSDGVDIYPRTILEGIFRKSDGLTLERILEEIKSGIGNALYATFQVDAKTGSLLMVSDDSYAGPKFRLVDGELEVVYG